MKSILKIGGIVLTVALGVGLMIWGLRTPERESLSETAPDAKSLSVKTGNLYQSNFEKSISQNRKSLSVLNICH